MSNRKTYALAVLEDVDVSAYNVQSYELRPRWAIKPFFRGLTYPLRSGYVNNDNEAIRRVFRFASSDGYGWPASPYINSDQAYFLKINASEVGPLRGPDSRRFGFPLRCLSTTAGGTKNRPPPKLR